MTFTQVTCSPIRDHKIVSIASGPTHTAFVTGIGLPYLHVRSFEVVKNLREFQSFDLSIRKKNYVCKIFPFPKWIVTPTFSAPSDLSHRSAYPSYATHTLSGHMYGVWHCILSVEFTKRTPSDCFLAILPTGQWPGSNLEPF